MEWEIRVSTVADARAALVSLEKAGVTVEATADGGLARDPWGTAVRLRGGK